MQRAGFVAMNAAAALPTRGEWKWLPRPKRRAFAAASMRPMCVSATVRSDSRLMNL